MLLEGQCAHSIQPHPTKVPTVGRWLKLQAAATCTTLHTMLGPGLEWGVGARKVPIFSTSPLQTTMALDFDQTRMAEQQRALAAMPAKLKRDKINFTIMGRACKLQLLLVAAAVAVQCTAKYQSMLLLKSASARIQLQDRRTPIQTAFQNCLSKRMTKGPAATGWCRRNRLLRGPMYHRRLHFLKR